MDHPTIRLCFARVRHAISLENDKMEGMLLSQKDKPTFGDFRKTFMNEFVDIFFRPNFNYTVHGSDGEGLRDSHGNFTGCNGQLRRNESDAGLYLYYYPSFDDSLDVSQVTSEAGLTILSMYNTTVEKTDMNITDSFNSLSLGVWILFFITCTFLAYTIRKIERRTLRHKSIVDIILLHIFHQGDVTCRRRWFPRWQSVNLSILVFFISLVYVSLIKTDIVVIEKPFIYQTYGDVISRLDTMTAKFWFAVDVPYDFKHGQDGSPENVIWERIKGRDNFLKEYFPHRLRELSNGSSVEILDSEYSYTMLRLICSVKLGPWGGLFQGKFPWMSKEQSSRKVQRGLIFRNGVNKQYRKMVLQKATQMVESGMYDRWYQSITGYSKMKVGKDFTMADFDNCISLQVQLPESVFHALTIRNFYRLLYCLSTIIGLAVVVVLKERLIVIIRRRYRRQLRRH